MKKLIIYSFVLTLCMYPVVSKSQKKATGRKTTTENDSLKDLPMPGMKFRSIGPAITGGRVVDFAVNPEDHSEYYVAVGHGSLWKTVNHGTTFEPVFDDMNTQSIGVVEIDPSNPNVVWVGTGENDNQNNVIYGSGVYKSEDGGKHWVSMGLKESEHIGDIVINPENTDEVYVAAYGSSRNPGGERGIYLTKDGGKNWERVLFVSDNTGFYELHMDPRYPEILYAVAHQRMRNLYTSISGGPETAIYRCQDSGASWEKLTTGLPSAQMGRIGMAISPVNPDILYAIVEAEEDAGFYKSTDRGSSWEKQSDYVSAYPFYFQKIVCDTHDENRVYSLDIFLQVSTDGGKSWSDLGEDYKHVDNHALWINPYDNRNMIAGCDGGVYETYDMGKSWSFRDNIPITEIYKVSTDNALPFYNVYIGTQDNNSLGGPSRTINSSGITNRDWTFTQSGDGFETQVDWQDPDVVYSQAQYGNLVRYNRKTGERVFIKPYNNADTSYRFDWDAALLISRHAHKRLYFGANRVFRTDDRGNSWKVISPDLTRGVPESMQKLMGRSWSIDELARKGTMAQITTIAESPLDENILYAGSGDGLIHYTRNGGTSWSAASSVPGLPEYARIHQITASHFDDQVAFAACHNFTGGDYRPYLYKTTDGGKNWFSINANLPAKGSTYTIAEDNIKPGLLFVGTQNGVYFTVDSGQTWISLSNGIPTMQVMDLDIQERENDLVVSTFGRGVYILDDYTPLRFLETENLQKEAFIFPIRDARMFVEASPFGFSGKGFRGGDFYSAPNPKLGAVFTFYIRNDYKSLKKKRRDAEKEKQEKGEDVAYPSLEELRKERDEATPYLLFTVSDETGHVVRKIKHDVTRGVNRIVWDFRYAPFSPIETGPAEKGAPWDEPDRGYMVVPGKYTVSLQEFDGSQFRELVSPQPFVCKPLESNGNEAADPDSLERFNRKVAGLLRAMNATDAYREELENKMPYLKKAVLDGADVPTDAYDRLILIENNLKSLNINLNGEPLRARFEGAAPTSIRERVNMITENLWQTTSPPTETYLHAYETAAGQFGDQLDQLYEIDHDIKEIESFLEQHNAQFTPGRLPVWEQ